MSLSPLEQKHLEIRSFPETKRNSIFSFELAMRRNVNHLMEDQIKYYRESDKGSVINIYGPNKSGRTTTAKTLATLINRERDPEQNKKLLCVTLNFLKAQEEIEQEDIIIIEQGEKIKDYKEKADTYGLEQIVNACSQKNAMAIIVSDSKLIKDNIQADYYLKCEAIDKKEQITYCILEINKFHVGYVGIFKLHNEVIERAYELAKEEFLKSEVQRILENIDETTKEVLKRWKKRKEIIFAEDPKDIDPEDPAILFIPVIILGGQGEGKSTLSKILVNVLSEYYSVHNVHSLRHERDLTGMIQNGFSSEPKKYVQVFVANDFTFTKAGLGDLQEYSKIRHFMCNKAGIKQGLAIPIMCLHYLTGKGSDVAYRNLVSFMFVLNPSDHQYTRENILAKLMPESHLKFLDYIVKLREQAELEGKAKEFLRLKGFGVCIIKGVSYPFYFNRKDYPIAKIESYESTAITRETRKIDDSPLKPSESADFHVFYVAYLTRVLSQVYENEEHILAFFAWRYMTPSGYSVNKIFKILEKEYTMIATRGPRAGEKMRARSVGDLAKEFYDANYESVSETIGEKNNCDVLEKALRDYLNFKFQTHHKSIKRFSGGGKPDLLLGTDLQDYNQLAINAKYQDETRGSWDHECFPENDYQDCWIAHYSPGQGLSFFHNQERKKKMTCSMEKKISCDEFIQYLEENYSEGEP